jgi:hypothetical protein
MTRSDNSFSVFSITMLFNLGAPSPPPSPPTSKNTDGEEEEEEEERDRWVRCLYKNCKKGSKRSKGWFKEEEIPACSISPYNDSQDWEEWVEEDWFCSSRCKLAREKQIKKKEKAKQKEKEAEKKKSNRDTPVMEPVLDTSSTAVQAQLDR